MAPTLWRCGGPPVCSSSVHVGVRWRARCGCLGWTFRAALLAEMRIDRRVRRKQALLWTNGLRRCSPLRRKPQRTICRRPDVGPLRERAGHSWPGGQVISYSMSLGLRGLRGTTSLSGFRRLCRDPTVVVGRSARVRFSPASIQAARPSEKGRPN